MESQATLAKPQRNQKTIGKPRQMMAYLWLFVGLFWVPELVMAGPIENGVEWVLDLLTSGIARSLAIIGIVILGYLAWAGRITGEQCGKYIAGVVLVFGGPTLVDLLITAVGVA